MAAKTFVRSGQYPSRWNTARIADFAHDALGVTDITFETSYACSHTHLFTRACYQAAGESIARAIMQHLANRPAD